MLQRQLRFKAKPIFFTGAHLIRPDRIFEESDAGRNFSEEALVVAVAQMVKRVVMMVGLASEVQELIGKKIF
jgi:hypothetical protein